LDAAGSGCVRCHSPTNRSGKWVGLALKRLGAEPPVAQAARAAAPKAGADSVSPTRPCRAPGRVPNTMVLLRRSGLVIGCVKPALMRSSPALRAPMLIVAMAGEVAGFGSSSRVSRRVRSETRNRLLAVRLRGPRRRRQALPVPAARPSTRRWWARGRPPGCRWCLEERRSPRGSGPSSRQRASCRRDRRW
jgi:hypothetical protein